MPTLPTPTPTPAADDADDPGTTCTPLGRASGEARWSRTSPEGSDGRCGAPQSTSATASANCAW